MLAARIQELTDMVKELKKSSSGDSSDGDGQSRVDLLKVSISLPRMRAIR
jgi:hypothetical protein